MKSITTLVAALVIVAACGGGSAEPDEDAVAVGGYVHAGPVCPVVQDPPDPACADRPVDGAEILVLDDDGATVDSVSTSATGMFSILLRPGTYTFVPQPVEGLLGTADAQQVVVATPPASLDFAYDTGIR